MNKICTSLEQSKKLIELGIDIKTADLTVTNYPLQNGSRFDFICCKLPNDTFPSITDGKSEKIPAWSLTALLGLIPFQIIEKNERYGFRQWKGYNSQGETYCFEYVSSTNQRLYETYHWNNPIDAAFEMVCWLKENNLK